MLIEYLATIVRLADVEGFMITVMLAVSFYRCQTSYILRCVTMRHFMLRFSCKKTVSTFWQKYRAEINI